MVATTGFESKASGGILGGHAEQAKGLVVGSELYRSSVDNMNV